MNILLLPQDFQQAHDSNPYVMTEMEDRRASIRARAREPSTAAEEEYTSDDDSAYQGDTQKEEAAF